MSRAVSAWASAGALLPYRRDRFTYQRDDGQRRMLFRAASVLPFATAGVTLEL